MRIAVISDIHANVQAFEAVLADIEAAAIDRVWCLGDLVGYGADPDACMALARANVDLCLAGNHDLAVRGDLPLGDFAPTAHEAVAWTRAALAAEHVDALRDLASHAERDGMALYHGSPRDPVWEYVLSTLLADLCLDAAPTRVALIGHSHVALSFRRVEGEPATGQTRRPGDELDLSRDEWLVNPGSVGQPRDGDPRAAWLVLDTDAQTARFQRTPYDVDAAAAAIRAAGLPESLAERLGRGQ